MKDEETPFVLGGVDEVLVVEAGVPKRLELPLFPRFGISGDRWVVFVEGGIVLVERSCYSWLVLVGRVGEYEAGEFSSFRSGEADRETRLEEYFCTPWRLSSFGWPDIVVKSSMAASNLLEMSDGDVVVAWGLDY